MAIRIRSLSGLFSGTVFVDTRTAAAINRRPWSTNETESVRRRVGPRMVDKRPARREPSMKNVMASRERSHCRPLLPAGRWAVLRARKIVFPGHFWIISFWMIDRQRENICDGKKSGDWDGMG